MISLCVMGSLIDVGGQSWMLVTLSGPLGLGALSLQRPPCGALPAGIRCCGSFRWGWWGGAWWGVITHACEGPLRVMRFGGCCHLSGWSLPPLWHRSPCLSVYGWSRESPRSTHPAPPPPPSPLLYPCLDNRMGFSGGLEVAPTPVVPAKQAPRAASNYFITLHQIKSNKLITNDCGHASSKYRINIIDLILSMLSEKLINAGAKITALFSRATATIGWIKRSHEVHSSKVNSSDASAIHTETLG